LKSQLPLIHETMKYYSILWATIFCIAICSSAQAQINPDSHRALLNPIHEWMIVNSNSVFTFWDEKSAINNARNGFYGNIDVDGTISIGQRNSIQQGRQLFTIAIWYRFMDQSEDVALTAYNQLQYFLETFHDPEGGEFFIQEDHKPDNKTRRIYNSSFAIYGLSHYFMAFHDHDNELYRNAANEALNIALKCFVAMDKRTHDAAYLGYQQIPVDDLAQNEIPLDGGDKEANTHLHIMEALTSLYEAWKPAKQSMQNKLSSDDYSYVESQLQKRLDEMLVDVMVNRFCTERDEYAYCRTEFTRDWTLVNDQVFSFAHDIENAWLFMEALRVLGDEVSDQEAVTTMAEKLIHTVFSHGMEPVDNGYASIALGNISDLSVSSDNKDWWQHFEAFAGLYMGARLSSSNEQQHAYLKRLMDILTYLDEGDLIVRFSDNMWEYRWENTLAGPWKAGYHSLRAMVFVKQWIEEDTGHWRY